MLKPVICCFLLVNETFCQGNLTAVNINDQTTLCDSMIFALSQIQEIRLCTMFLVALNTFSRNWEGKFMKFTNKKTVYLVIVNVL